MGLAAAQSRFLCLTQRKADCENRLSINAIEKMALTREMSELSQEYYSKLQAKNISYYANGKYNKMNYQYLMGYGSNYTTLWNDGYALKDKNTMILTDYKGRVVLSNDYARAITSVLGSSVMDPNGVGSTFSADRIPEILDALIPGFSAQEFQTVIDGGQLSSTYNANVMQTISGEYTGEQTVVDNSSSLTDKVKSIIDFYHPIFAAAASNGWTTEYCDAMATNENYVSDALVTGGFQLTNVNEAGSYDEGCSLTYYITSGFIEARNDSDVREEVTAWYNAEKERLGIKETFLDLDNDNISTELNAVTTEMKSIETFIKDAISSVYDWGNS